MKRAVLLGLILLTIVQTEGFSQKKRERVKVNPDSVTVDSVEYKLIITDSGFDSWLATKPPANFYSKEYYEHRNILLVTEWNIRNQNPLKYGDLYDTRIDYYPNIDYGIDLNYRLYYYFRFFEETNHVKLIDQSGERF
jgi:hypothetical protein